MNNIAENLTGWIQEDAINKDLVEIFSIQANDESKSNEIMLDEFSGDHVLLNDKNGTKIPVSADFNHITDNNGNINGMTLVFRDIL